MRFDVIAAIILGILIPTLETVRRGIDYWSVSFTTMFEDYLAGIALIVCALGALRGARWAPLSLLIVWSGVASMMLLSTVSQIERHLGRCPGAAQRHRPLCKASLVARVHRRVEPVCPD